MESGTSHKMILVFGNPLVKGDSLILEILPELRQAFPEVEFVHCDALEELQEYGRTPIIIDVAEGITKIELITDFDSLAVSPIFTGHDLDLAYMLKLMKKIGKIDKARIIAVPKNYPKSRAIAELKPLITKALST